MNALSNHSSLEPAIVVDHVTVSYRSYEQRPTSLKESALRFIRGGGMKNYSMFQALRDVSFSVKKGEVFGIIGSNGSGKSTMLKLLAGVLKPTEGSVRVAGSIASLIELGVGFDPELNAIENIYLNGSLYRKTKAEIKERVEGILDFAELHQFASTPIKYYSSGMSARLGFAAAVDINPDVLLVDEVLAVGDERFQEKCRGVFEKFLTSGRTIVMVSHDLHLIENTCHEVALLSRGELVFLGDASTALHLYREPSYRTALGG